MPRACCNGIVHFNHYGREPIALGVDLANDPPRDAPELVRRCTSAGLVIDLPTSEDDLDHTLGFLDRWRAIAAQTDRGRRADALNVLLAEYAAAPRLTDHAGDGWHLHFREDDVAVGRQIAALITVGTALHLTQLGMDRWGVCAAGECERVFADVSRGGRQRHCSPACANRERVRRHRAGSGGVRTSRPVGASANRST
ncbi:CGNR zinc finger domain-containing protein [Pseudoclavibacter chungangensis]|uniref:CGNR zinc finger domain-containing protein n=1 Tax=Pseudoclavibacter chungangensis TaxID=587635 RepID=A0A7J5BQP8_9MICO|nr:CGNR zinc finger domain-containing protein [Pseudoclavibacter chungangensis]